MRKRRREARLSGADSKQRMAVLSGEECEGTSMIFSSSFFCFSFCSFLQPVISSHYYSKKYHVNLLCSIASAQFMNFFTRRKILIKKKVVIGNLTHMKKEVIIRMAHTTNQTNKFSSKLYLSYKQPNNI